MTIVTLIGWFPIIAVVFKRIYDSDSDSTDLMLLEVFLVTVTCGFFWCCVLYWPYSIESVFLRRCTLSEASFVAVYHCKKEEETSEAEGEKQSFQKKLVHFVSKGIKSFMVFIYATEELHVLEDDCRLEFCQVHKNSDGSRYIVFLFRRYNYSAKAQLFISGEWSIGNNISDFVPLGIHTMDKMEMGYELAIRNPNDDDVKDINSTILKYLQNVNGLTEAEVLQRRNVVGRNVIEMKKPSYFRIFRQEISRFFYLYQAFVLWFWLGVDYWFMAIVNWGIVLLSAFTISFFRYRSAKVLYRITNVSGTSRVLRDKELVLVDQDALVPGDIVHVTPGVIHADMILLTGEVIMDESCLTGEATPQAKIAIDHNCRERYNDKTHQKQTLIAGTLVQECHDAIAVVKNTASYTRKGELSREVIAFRGHKLQYELDLPMAVACLAFYSFAILIVVVFQSGADPVMAWVLGL